jgi:RNA ligase (TIGR02306 family)
VQVLQDLLDKYAGETCYVTEKLDGSSVTYYLKEGGFGVCSRNLDLLETPENSLWKVARALGVEAKMRSMGRNFALQGEIIGEGIQGNKYNLRGQMVYFFNAFDVDAYRYLDYAEFIACLNGLDLPVVPVLDTAFPLDNDINALVEFSKRKSTLNPAVWAEGVVIRPVQERQDALGRVSFKAINPEFLLKYE